MTSLALRAPSCRLWGLHLALYLIAGGSAAGMSACAPRAPVLEARDPTPEAPATGVLRVVDLNAWGVPFRHAHDELLGRLAERITELRPDIVALQEVWFEEDANALAAALRRGGLTHVHHRATNEVMAYDSSGLLIASRHPITAIAFHQFRAGRSPSLPWHPDWFSGKGVLLATIRTPRGEVEVANLHLHADYEGVSYADVRMAQAVEAATFLRERFAAPARILVGDFNGRTDAPEVRLLRAATAVSPLVVDDVDAILAGGPAPRTLIASGVTLRSPVTVAGEPLALSDHAGLFVDLGSSVDPSTDGGEASAIGISEALRSEIDRRLEKAKGAEVRLQGVLAGIILLMMGALVWLRRGGPHRASDRRNRLAAMGLLAFGVVAVGHQLLWMSPSRQGSLDEARAALIHLSR